MKKPNMTKLENLNAEKDQYKDLRAVKEQILSKYKLDKLICFGSKTNPSAEKVSCFLESERVSIPQTELDRYYLLVVPSKEEPCPDILIQQRIEEDFKSSISLTILVHRMVEFNSALANGSSFFTSIYKKGIIIHDDNEDLFITPAKGNPIKGRITKKEAFWKHWYKLSTSFTRGGNVFTDDQDNGIAVFMYHQALQHCYSAMLRVLIGYKTNSNSLPRLTRLIDIALPDFSFIPQHRSTPEDSRLLGLLLKGFSDARYDNRFEATTEDLVAIMNKVNKILEGANEICMERITNLQTGKTPYLP